MSDIGHNDPVGADQLRLFLERIERLTEEKKGILDDIKDVFGEAKATGYDVKAMRFVLKQRAMEKERRDQERATQEAYLNALGLL